MSEPMTPSERTELARVVRIRARVAKSDVDAIAARHLADIEAQLAAQFSANHSAWADITAEAQQVIAAADSTIAARCREMGIPEEFRPGLHVSWFNRGENAEKARRAELRKLAEAELGARAKRAKVEIERAEAHQLTQLASGALTSDEAKAFLAAAPTIEQLMPGIALPALEMLAANGGAR